MLALVVRLLAVGFDGEYQPRHDAFDYDRHGLSIAAGEGFPDSGYVPDGGPSALRAPGYPYLLGGIYAVSSDSVTVARVVNAVLGALAVLLLYLLVGRIWGVRIAALTASLAAIYPPLVGLSAELYSENLFIPLLLAAVLAVLRFRESGAARWSALAGTLAGLAALTRGPGVIALLPLVIGLWVLRPRLSARALAAPALALLCAVVTIAPWTIRNAVEFGRFVPITSSTGFGLAGTYNDVSRDDDGAPAAWRTPVIVPAYAPLFRTPGVDEATLDSALLDEATDYALAHPGYVLEASWHNLLRLTYLEGDSVVAFQEEVRSTGIGNRGSPLEMAGLLAAAALAVVGVVMILRSRREAPEGTARVISRMIPTGPMFIWLIPIALVLIAAPVAGLPRYRIPADPFLLILAAVGLASVIDFVRARLALPARVGALFGAFLAAAALGGCGGDDSSGSTQSTTGGQVPGASKADYLRRADAVCARANAASRRLVQDVLGNGGLSGGDPLRLTTEQLVAPGIKIRDREARRLRALERPAGESEGLDEFLGLFDPLGELSRERLRFGEAGDQAGATRIEGLLTFLSSQQIAAASEFGFDDCAVDVIAEAFG